MSSLAGFSALALMELHINTLFGCDLDGRLRHVNEVGKPQPPRFFLGRTHEGLVWRFRHDLPADTTERLDRLCRAEPHPVDFSCPPQNEAALKAVLDEHAPLVAESRGPAYWVAEDTPPAAAVLLLSESHADLVRDTFPWLLSLLRDRRAGPVAAVVEEGRAVSICFCSRTPQEATEAGVETLAAFRGRGYATAAVAGWAAEVRRQGIIPLYSTSWENLASQAIARKLRMVFYGEDWWLR